MQMIMSVSEIEASSKTLTKEKDDLERNLNISGECGDGRVSIGCGFKYLGLPFLS